MADNLGMAYEVKRRNRKMAQGGMIEAETPNQMGAIDQPDAPEKKEKKGLLSGLGLAKGGEVNPKLEASHEKSSMPKGSHSFYIDGNSMADKIMEKRKKMSHGGSCYYQGGMAPDPVSDEEMDKWFESHDFVNENYETPKLGPEDSMGGFEDLDQQSSKKRRKSMIRGIMSDMHSKESEY